MLLNLTFWKIRRGIYEYLRIVLLKENLREYSGLVNYSMKNTGTRVLFTLEVWLPFVWCEIHSKPSYDEREDTLNLRLIKINIYLVS